MDNPVNIMVAHIGQRHIISLKKRQAGIVIFKIESFPHTRRHLVNKAAHTLVSAGTVFVHQTVFKFQSQILLKLFLYFQLPLFSVWFAHQKFYIFVIYQVMVIKHIFYCFPVNGEQLISRLQFQFPGNTSFLYPADFMSAIFHFLPPANARYFL